ncbi:hypothetical protein EG327_006832 [Venturia inaequalis]|uniref:Store-operated calcium entry-associated regulatory factor n=1 Tax=Venturia inaequalis TaxID=5025 RepID=A0A8H3VQC3_VENIN|nr:hypothetical protein EG327_006832 [Venturia inaequalis]
MKAHSFFIKAVSALLGLLAVTAAAETRQSKVLLKNIQSLTLKKGLQTSHRRVEPVPQLKCIGGSGKPHYEVDVMRCTNSGSGYDSNDVEWTCKASLPPEFKLGSTDVICEGYSDSDDPYILKGSCGVEYRLLLTELGQQKYGSKKPAWRSTSPKSESSSGDYDYTQTDAVIMYLFWALFAGVALWMLYSFIKNYFAGNTGLPRNPVRFPGGGNGGGDDDPPPPYDYRPSDSSYRYPPRKPSSSNSQGWRPGFWSGAVGGAAAGYAMGSRANQNRNQTYTQAQERGNGWFGGGQQQQARNNGWFGGGDAGEGPSGSRGSSGSSSPPSSSRYDSTGFGSTRRR